MTSKNIDILRTSLDVWNKHDWKKAATGHGAAGAIPKSDLARLEAESAPGKAPPR